VSSSTC